MNFFVAFKWNRSIVMQKNLRAGNRRAYLHLELKMKRTLATLLVALFLIGSVVNLTDDIVRAEAVGNGNRRSRTVTNRRCHLCGGADQDEVIRPTGPNGWRGHDQERQK